MGGLLGYDEDTTTEQNETAAEESTVSELANPSTENFNGQGQNEEGIQYYQTEDGHFYYQAADGEYYYLQSDPAVEYKHDSSSMQMGEEQGTGIFSGAEQHFNTV